MKMKRKTCSYKYSENLTVGNSSLNNINKRLTNNDSSFTNATKSQGTT